MRSFIRRTYEFNEHFLDSIDSEAKAYFLGLFFADGCNSCDGRHIYITLQERDAELLEELRIAIGYFGPLRKCDRGRKGIHYTLSIGSKYLCKRLTELGCPPAKTFGIKFPEYINGELMPHFLRGYLDGDGSIFVHRHSAVLKVVGSDAFITSLRTWFVDKLHISGGHISPHHSFTGISTLNITGNIQAIKVLDYLYGDATIYMKRKCLKKLEADKTADLHRAKCHSVLCVICNKPSHALGLCKHHCSKWYQTRPKYKSIQEYIMENKGVLNDGRPTTKKQP